jgi:hypothetical protein
MIFQQLEAQAYWFKQKLSAYTPYDEGHDYPWENHLFKASHFRRAHLDIVDVRDTKKLYMMHLCIFPNVKDPSPIYGFDLIAGPGKVTGAFHDFSPVVGNTIIDTEFARIVKEHHWSKERELPDWAKAIFSPHMVAAGNITTEKELARFLDLAKKTTELYLTSVGSTDDIDHTDKQNKYCYNQKQNPHTPRVMSSLGFEPEVVHEFIDKCLFPEI